MKLLGRTTPSVVVERAGPSPPTTDNLELGATGGQQAIVQGRWLPLVEHPIVLAICNLADNRLRRTRILFENEDGGDMPPPRWWSSFDRKSFISGAIKSLWLWGNLYAIEHRDRQGKVLGLELVDPSIVSVTLEDGRIRYRVNGVEIATSGFRHVKYSSVPGQILGIGAIEASIRNLQMGVGADQFLVEHMKRGPNLRTIFKSEKPIGPKQTRDMQRMIQAQTSGPEMAWRPMFVSGVDVVQIGVNLADGQFRELANWSDARLCAAFQVDPSLLSVPSDSSRMTYQNVAQRDRLLWVDALAGLADRMEIMWSSVAGVGRTARFDDSRWMLGGISDRVAVAEKLALLNKHMGASVISNDQILDFLGLPR